MVTVLVLANTAALLGGVWDTPAGAKEAAAAEHHRVGASQPVKGESADRLARGPVVEAADEEMTRCRGVDSVCRAKSLYEQPPWDTDAEHVSLDDFEPVPGATRAPPAVKSISCTRPLTVLTSSLYI